MTDHAFPVEPDLQFAKGAAEKFGEQIADRERAWYLGEEVQVIGRADKPGWWECAWPSQNGKVYKHYWQDLKTERYGKETWAWQ